MSETVNIFGNDFLVLKKGDFSSIKGIQWIVLYVSETQKIITIPIGYGQEKAKKLLETKYFFNFAIDPISKCFVISVKDYPLEIMCNELSNL